MSKITIILYNITFWLFLIFALIIAIYSDNLIEALAGIGFLILAKLTDISKELYTIKEEIK